MTTKRQLQEQNARLLATIEAQGFGTRPDKAMAAPTTPPPPPPIPSEVRVAAIAVSLILKDRADRRVIETGEDVEELLAEYDRAAALRAQAGEPYPNALLDGELDAARALVAELGE